MCWLPAALPAGMLLSAWRQLELHLAGYCCCCSELIRTTTEASRSICLRFFKIYYDFRLAPEPFEAAKSCSRLFCVGSPSCVLRVHSFILGFCDGLIYNANMAMRIKVDASMKPRTATTVHCSASPRTAAYYAKSRRDGLNARHIYTALLCGAVCFSTWALLSHQVSSSLPTHGPASIWPSQPPGNSDSSAKSSLRRGPSSLLFASLHKGSSSVSGGAAAVAASAAVLGSKAATRRLTFQRTKTAMPFIMMTCRMCDDPMSQQIAAVKMYDPVTSTLVEHALSNTPDDSRVFVEVGAGTGYFSMLAASWGTDVVAFEPNATSRQMLNYNAGLHKDGRMRIVPYALGARTTLATVLNQQNSSDSSSNITTTTSNSSSNSTAAPSPTFTPAATPTSTNSSNSSSISNGWPVDVLRLSDAIAGDANMTVLLINVPSLDGVSVPGFEEAAEGAYDMLTRVQVRLTGDTQLL